MEATAISANNTSIPDRDNTTPTELIGHDTTSKAFVKWIKDSSTKIAIAANYEADIVQLVNLKKRDVGKIFVGELSHSVRHLMKAWKRFTIRWVLPSRCSKSMKMQSAILLSPTGTIDASASM